MNRNTQVLESLTRSSIFRDYQRAFSEATGLPLSLRPTETWQRSMQAVPKENPFCAFIAAQSKSCSACLVMQEKLCGGAKTSAKAAACAFGLTEVAVPVRLGGETIGYLVTGQVFRKPATEEDFEKMLGKLKAIGIAGNREKLRESFFETKVVAPSVLESTTRLLEFFAEHLSMKSNEIVLQQANSEPPIVTRVKEFVQQHHEEDITLEQAARAAHASVFYLCRSFRKATGMCFTEYVSRTRVEKAKEMLMKPNVRVSEVAYQVGFQSLTHFNRIFKKIVGESPTEFRADLALAA